jgi:hypothetical protein
MAGHEPALTVRAYPGLRSEGPLGTSEAIPRGFSLAASNSPRVAFRLRPQTHAQNRPWQYGP